MTAATIGVDTILQVRPQLYIDLFGLFFAFVRESVVRVLMVFRNSPILQKQSQLPF